MKVLTKNGLTRKEKLLGKVIVECEIDALACNKEGTQLQLVPRTKWDALGPFSITLSKFPVMNMNAFLPGNLVAVRLDFYQKYSEVDDESGDDNDSADELLRKMTSEETGL